MQTGATDKKVFAHYVPWFSISFDNNAPTSDYYNDQYLNPDGEGGIHAAYGGYLRDRPIGRDPLTGEDWRYQDIVTEVRQAKSVGIDGFAVDIVSAQVHGEAIGNLLKAAEAEGNFKIQVTADMSGPMGSYTSEKLAEELAPILKSAAAQRLDDGRVVLGAFYAEAKPAGWWESTLSTLKTVYELDVAFVPTFLNADANMDAFASVSYGFSNWGGRNTATTNPNATETGMPANLIDRAHALGKVWMAPVAFEDNRPRSGIFEESNASATNTQMWTSAIGRDAEWVQMLTWNDYAEMTHMAPSADHGWGVLDMQAAMIAEFKYDQAPTVVRDAVYVSHRSQLAAAQATYQGTKPMQIVNGTPAAVDIVEVVTFAKEAGTIIAEVGASTYSCAVSAGRNVCSFRLETGAVNVRLERNGAAAVTVNSSHIVTATPAIQDYQYNVVGGLR